MTSSYGTWHIKLLQFAWSWSFEMNKGNVLFCWARIERVAIVSNLNLRFGTDLPGRFFILVAQIISKMYFILLHYMHLCPFILDHGQLCHVDLEPRRSQPTKWLRMEEWVLLFSSLHTSLAPSRPTSSPSVVGTSALGFLSHLGTNICLE